MSVSFPLTFDRLALLSGMILAPVFMLVAPLGCRPAPEAESPELMTIKSSVMFEDLVEKAHGPVLVDFWAPWCGPCRVMDPIIKKAAANYKGSMGVAKVNVDDNRVLADRFNIRAIPTFMLYYQGKAIAMYEGAMRAKELDQWIQEQLNQAGVTIAQPAK